MFEQIYAQLRAADPLMLALLLRGSYARGAAGPQSDLDLLVLHEQEPEVSYRSLIVEQPDGRLLHVTIGYAALTDYLEEIAESQEAEAWSLFLPVRDPARLIWVAPAHAEKLAGSLDTVYALSPQLQDMLECLGKLRNTYAQGDELGVRLAAQGVALRCPALLAVQSSIPELHSPLEALHYAAEMPCALPGYGADLLLCLGLSGQATSIDDVYITTMRLASAVLEDIRGRAATLEGLVEPDLPVYLRDGVLMRLVRQELG